MTILNNDQISTNDKRKYALDLIEEAIKKFSPENVMSKKFDMDISKYDKIYVIGFGKAAFKMYTGIREKIHNKIKYAGIIVPEDEVDSNKFSELEILKGSHPFISQISVDSSIKLMSNIEGLHENDLVIVLISGGGSALFEIPENNISVDNIMEISKEIMNNGGNIYDLNIIRSGISRVKNGKMAKYLYPARVVSYIISDVFFDDMSIIASGPLVKRKDEVDVKKIIQRYIKRDDLKIFALNNYRPNTLDEKYYSYIQNNIVLNNRTFVDYIYKNMDGNSICLGSNINGDIENVSNDILEILRKTYEIKNSAFWFVCGGETTVMVKGKGIGGRNEELVLKLFKKSQKNEHFLYLSFGTDGIDGLSPAAGGIVDNSTKIDNIDEYLQNNDSYHALMENGIITTGRTGNNVSDIILGYYSR